MLAGELYYAMGPELTNGRNNARRIVKKYNELDPEQSAEREATLTELMGSIGKNCFIETPFRCDYGFNIHIGKIPK